MTLLPAGLASCAQSEVRAHFTTSGTIGAPLRIAYSAQLFDRLAAVLTRFYARANLGPSSRVALGYEPRGAAFAMHAVALERAGIPFFFMRDTKPAAALRQLADRRATALFARASQALQLSAHARATRATTPTLAVVLASGMPLSNSGRDFIDDTLDVVTFRCAGATEVSLIAMECTHRHGMHLLNDLVHVEAAPAPGTPGAGKLVVSSLENDACHLFRYALGDLVELRAEPCPCGDPAPRMDIVGRIDDAVRLPDDTSLYAATLQRAINSVPGLTGGFQCLVRHTPRGVSLDLEVESWPLPRSQSERTLRALESALDEAPGPPQAAPRSWPMPDSLVLYEPGWFGRGGSKYRRVRSRSSQEET